MATTQDIAAIWFQEGIRTGVECADKPGHYLWNWPVQVEVGDDIEYCQSRLSGKVAWSSRSSESCRLARRCVSVGNSAVSNRGSTCASRPRSATRMEPSSWTARSMPDPYYSDRGTWHARWPLSRVARYLFTFVLGTLTGAGLAARFTEHRATSYARAITNRSINRSAIIAPRPHAEERDVEVVIRKAIQAEFDGMERRVVAIEASLESIDQSVQAMQVESSCQTTNPQERYESDSVAATVPASLIPAASYPVPRPRDSPTAKASYPTGSTKVCPSACHVGSSDFREVPGGEFAQDFKLFDAPEAPSPGLSDTVATMRCQGVCRLSDIASVATSAYAEIMGFAASWRRLRRSIPILPEGSSGLRPSHMISWWLIRI